jgi:hypothetical protein
MIVLWFITDKEKSEDTNGIIRSRADNIMAERKGTKGQATIFNTLHRKQKIEQLKPSS